VWSNRFDAACDVGADDSVPRPEQSGDQTKREWGPRTRCQSPAFADAA
jgi:hypothetical protein